MAIFFLYSLWSTKIHASSIITLKFGIDKQESESKLMCKEDNSEEEIIYNYKNSYQFLKRT